MKKLVTILTGAILFSSCALMKGYNEKPKTEFTQENPNSFLQKEKTINFYYPQEENRPRGSILYNLDDINLFQKPRKIKVKKLYGMHEKNISQRRVKEIQTPEAIKWIQEKGYKKTDQESQEEFQQYLKLKNKKETTNPEELTYKEKMELYLFKENLSKMGEAIGSYLSSLN